MAKPSSTPTIPCIALKPNLPDEWLSASHYHCKACQRPMRFLTRLPWTVGVGVRALGVCSHCDLLLIEAEKGKATWCNLNQEAKK